MARFTRCRARWPAAVLLAVPTVSGGCAQSRDPIEIAGGVAVAAGQICVAAFGHMSRSVYEFVDSGMNDVVRPGADFEEWRMRYGW